MRGIAIFIFAGSIGTLAGALVQLLAAGGIDPNILIINALVAFGISGIIGLICL